jgi:integrase
MPVTKGLTDAQIKNAKPGPKPRKLYDRDRLYLLVGVSGSKRWYWAYRMGDKDATYSIGLYPDVGLVDARKARDKAAESVARGESPGGVKPAQSAQATASLSLTPGSSLWAVSEEWLIKKTPNWGKAYADKVRALMERYIRDGKLGKTDVSEIETGQLYELVTSVAIRTGRDLVEGERKATAPHNAVLLRRCLDAVFRLAKIKSLIKSNPMADLRASDVIEKPKTRHNTKLDDNGLIELHTALTAYRGQRSTKLAIELLMLTALRTVEVRGADWKEIDFAGQKWNIPASRMKRRIAHSIPLSNQAISVLEKLKIITGGKGWIFPNQRRPDDFMATTTINAALGYMGFSGEKGNWFRAHGARGSFSSWAYKNGYRTEAIEQQLAHLERDETKRAYLESEFMKERIEIMGAWGNYLDSLKPNAV